jgi:hypothetical protein
VGYVGSRYRVEVVFKGCHSAKEEDIVFDSIAINYSHLETWLGITGFSGGFRIAEAGNVNGEIKYELPERTAYRVDDLTIAFYHVLNVAGDRLVDIHAKQTSFVEITPDHPMHYNDYHQKVIYHLRNFLSLGTGTAVLPLIVKARSKACTSEDSKGESVPCDVHIFYIAKGAAVAEKKHLDRRDMPFRYQDIADDFPKYLRCWFTKAEKLRPVFDLYFGIFYVPSMYVHLEFLTLAQALETYHRRMHDGVFMPPEQYKAIQQALNRAIPQRLDSDHRDALESRIQFGNEYPLRKRLKLILAEVLAPYKPTVDRLVYDGFVSEVVDTRNYLTHYTEKPGKASVTDPNEQYCLAQKMKLLMQLCLFAELGLPADTVKKLTSNSREFQRWLH